MTLLYRFGRGVLLLAMRIWHRLDVQGIENIPEGGGYILCSNHRTNLDPAYVAWKVRRQLFFMAKVELFSVPLFGAVLHGLGAFPVERGKGDTGALDYAERTVKSGGILAIFPEGTRSKDGKLLRGKSGAAVIASRTGADVLPVGVKYEEPVRFRSHITICYGKLIPNAEIAITNNSPTEIKAATKRIMTEIATLVGQELA